MDDAIVRDDSTLVLPILRFVKQGYLNLLAEPDGNVLFSMLQRDVQTCRLGSPSGNGAHFGYRMRTTVRDTPTLVGLVGGTLADGKVRLLHRYEDGRSRTIVAGNRGYIEEDGAFTFFDWAGNKLDVIYSPEGRTMHDPRFFGDTLVFVHEGLAYQTLFTYTLESKRKVFRTFGDDETRGVADLGSDRSDWVWMEGYGRAPGSRDAYPHVRMMTAKVTSDGSEPVPRVVRDGFVGYPFGTEPWKVACGYAARKTALLDATGKLIQPVVIVRLSDGQAHYIQSRSEDEVNLTHPIGLTCDEVFFNANEQTAGPGTSRPNIFRIRIDSLGPDRLVPPSVDAGN